MAERLLNIALLAARHPSFESAIINGQINQLVAALLARPSTPPEVLEVVLADPAPLSVAAVQRSIRAARQGELANHHPVENVETPLLAGASPVPQGEPLRRTAQLSSGDFLELLPRDAVPTGGRTASWRTPPAPTPRGASRAAPVGAARPRAAHRSRVVSRSISAA